jgi:hypothetical protein
LVVVDGGGDEGVVFEELVSGDLVVIDSLEIKKVLGDLTW